MALYNAIRALIIVGIIVAVAFIALCVGIVAVLGAVVYGAASPSRTPTGALRSLAANTRAVVELVQARGRPT